MRVPRGLLIGRARLQGAPHGDLGAQRLRLAHLLERVDIRPPGRPPSAILLVRSLGPLPGGGDLGPISGQSSGRLAAALQGRLSDAWARAIRPRMGQVPSGVEALWFLDEAEFLAFLALGRRERWWWEALPDPGGLFPLLAGRPEALPGALLRLVEWGEAGRVLGQLSPPEARGLLEQLRATFRLPTASSSATTAGGPAQYEARSIIPAPAPWEPSGITQSLLQRLGPERGRLLRTAVAMDRAPALLRRWGEVPALAAPGLSSKGESPARVLPSEERRAPVPLAEPTGLAREVDVANPVTIEPTPTPANQAQRNARSNETPEFQPGPPLLGLPSVHVAPGAQAHPQRPDSSPAAPLPERKQPEPDHRPDLAESGPAAISPPRTAHQEPPMTAAAASDAPFRSAPLASAPVQSAQPTRAEQAERAPDQPLQTALGGVLYLLNLLAQHDLPQRDEPTWRLASGLGAGGLLRLLSGPLLPGTERDQLWGLLAELDGLPLDQPLGAAMAEVREEPQGSTPAPDSSGQPLLTPAPWFDPTGAPLQTLLGQDLAPPLRAWMRRVLPPLLASIAAAIGEEPSRLAPYLNLPARLWLTPTHLDLELAVDLIALPIRLAGLDANPGWVPALGRVVSFHFR